jgi:hypothetical protein
MCWTGRTRSDDGRVGGARLCQNSNEWRTWHSCLGIGTMQLIDAELWVIRLEPWATVTTRERLPEHEVKTVAVFSESQAAIRCTPYVQPGPGPWLPGRIKWTTPAILTYSIATKYHRILGYPGIPENEDPDRQGNLAQDTGGSTQIKPLHTSASNRARHIAVGRSASQAVWEANNWSKHCSNRLMGQTGTNGPVPMTCTKLLATRLYRL